MVPTTQSTPSEALVAELDSAQRALKEVWLQILCGLSCSVSQPSSWSRMVLHEQHSDMKIGLSGIAAWQDSAFCRDWCEKP